MHKQLYRNILPRIDSHYFQRNYRNGTNDNQSNIGYINRRRFLRQSQGQHAYSPEEMPTNPTIVLFPGQGSQFVGMAKSIVDIPAATELFEIASDVLG